MKEWYGNSWSYVVGKLNTDIYSGLSTALVQEKLKLHGENRVISGPIRNILSVVLESMGQFWFIYMIINSILFAYIESYLYSLLLITIAVVVLMFHIITVRNGEKGLELLKDLDSAKVKVIREGRTSLLSVKEIVVGDIVIIDKGAAVPADLRLVEVDKLKIKESAVTGEELIVEKFETKIDYEINSLSEMRNIAFKGSIVVDGSGIGVVIATGMDTAIGNVIRLANHSIDDKNSLIKKVSKIMNNFGIICFCVSSALISYKYSIVKDLKTSLDYGVKMLFSIFPYGIAIAYSYIYIFFNKKFNINGIKLRSFDTINRIADTSLIVFDKLGALSKNVMEVKEIYTNDKIYSSSQSDLLKEYNIDRIIHTIILCNNSKYDIEKDLIKGSIIEGAFLKFGADKEIFRGLLEMEQPRIFEIPFDTQKKIMTTVNRVDGNYRAYIKGNVDSILSLCTHIMKDGIEKEIEVADILNIKENDMNMSGKGLNAVAVAYRNFNYEPSSSENIESNLVFVGLVAVENPLTEEAEVLLKRCKSLNIRPIIMSEDNKLTAYSIGKRLGLVNSIEGVLSDIEVSNMDFDELKRVISKVSILTKLSEDSKLRVAKALKEKESKLMFTGSSFTELPVLNNASISIATGDSCSSMLKRICDIYIKEDYLYSILNIIRSSRMFINNIDNALGYTSFYTFSQIALYMINTLSSPHNYVINDYFTLINTFLFSISVILILSGNMNSKDYFESAGIDSSVIFRSKDIKSITLGILTGLLAFAVNLYMNYLNIFIKLPVDYIAIVFGQLFYLYILKFRQ